MNKIDINLDNINIRLSRPGWLANSLIRNFNHDLSMSIDIDDDDEDIIDDNDITTTSNTSYENKIIDHDHNLITCNRSNSNILNDENIEYEELIISSFINIDLLGIKM